MNKRYDQEAAVAIRYPLSAVGCPLTAVCLPVSAFLPPTVILSEAKDPGKNRI
jgi:hypothetical protein